MIDRQTHFKIGSQSARSSSFRRSTTALLTSVALIAVAASSNSADAETLRDALATSYKDNPRLDAARATLRATDEEIARANSGYRPTINATADSGYQKVETNPSSTVTNGETHPRGFGVTGSQPIFRGFRTLNTVREAEATVRAGREILRTVEQAVLLDAVTAFMDVIRDAAIVKIRENNVDVLSKELRATRERFSVGEVTRTDVAQTEARRAGTVSALDLARANLKISRGNFERHIGRQPNGLSEPAAPMKILPKSLEEAISISARENPSMVASLYREQGARHTVDKIWGELLPSLQVDASYSKRFDPSIVTDRSETTTVTGRLTVPLYTSGEVQARVRQAKHTHVGRIQEIEQTRADVQALVVQAWSQLAAARAQLESDNAQVSALSTALTGVREEEKVGQRTLLDILNAEQELLNAQVNLAATKRNIVVTAYTLLSSVGRLNIQEIGGVHQVYDADAHYLEIRRKWWGVSITHADGRRELLDLWQSLGQVFHRETTDHGPPPTIHRPTASAPQRPVK